MLEYRFIKSTFLLHIKMNGIAIAFVYSNDEVDRLITQ